MLNHALYVFQLHIRCFLYLFIDAEQCLLLSSLFNNLFNIYFFQLCTEKKNVIFFVNNGKEIMKLQDLETLLFSHVLSLKVHQGSFSLITDTIFQIIGSIEDSNTVSKMNYFLKQKYHLCNYQ